MPPTISIHGLRAASLSVSMPIGPRPEWAILIFSFSGCVLPNICRTCTAKNPHRPSPLRKGRGWLPGRVRGWVAMISASQPCHQQLALEDQFLGQMRVKLDEQLVLHHQFAMPFGGVNLLHFRKLLGGQSFSKPRMSRS